MKIYYFSGATLPSETAQSVHVMKMCAALAKTAKENGVTLFAKGPSENTDDEIFKYYGVPQIFSLVVSRKVNIPAIGGFVRIAGHRLLVDEMGVPDLAYGRDPVELAALIQPNVPMIFEAHQLPTSMLQKFAINRLIRRKGLLKIVVITEALKRDYLKAFPKLRSERVFVAPDGADVPSAPVKAHEIGGRKEVPKVGYAGSMHEGKGMEVVALLSKQSPDFDFHVVGGNAEQVKFWKTKASANLYLHGHVAHSDVPGYLAAFDVLIAPYRSKARIGSGRNISKWISPLKIFEYMAAGKAILATDLPVIREVLTDGENALLVPPDDVKAWLAALERLKSPELRQSLAGQAFQDLEQRYSWRQRARTILKFVDKK